MRPYILAENNWKNVKETDFSIAILPWGATEAHNYHLPYATDVVESESIAAESAKIAWENDCKVVVLPAIPYGVNTGQSDIKLDININPSTQLLIVSDIVETLKRHGIKKLMILNSHGGNDFKPIIREVGLKFPDMFVCMCNWFQIKTKNDFFEEIGDHADEMETSLMMYLQPEFVLNLDEAGEGKEKKHIIKEFNEGWVWTERKWTSVTEDTGIGNPKKASAEKGKVFFKMITEKIAGILQELEHLDVKNMYRAQQ